MKFACDEMLGKLARWMRIVGLDVAYSNKTSDEDLVRLCRLEGRVLLTRDTRLRAESNNIPSLLVESDHYLEQLVQVLRNFKIDPWESAFSRCILCNGELHEEKKAGVREEVPRFVFETQEEFRRCPDCRKLYWPGTHRERIVKSLEELVGQPS